MIKTFLSILLLAGAESKRISEESRIFFEVHQITLKNISDLSECQEYKDMLQETQCVGFSVFDACPSRIITYDCTDVRNTGLIVGGEEAKPGEFPHMAGEIFFSCDNDSERFKYVLSFTFKQQSAG